MVDRLVRLLRWCSFGLKSSQLDIGACIFFGFIQKLNGATLSVISDVPLIARRM
jgi:hypothetical protein